MTIKEKIDAYVLAQGNQVGAGAEFASLLKEIVDSIPGGGSEPLILEGTIREGGFSPAPGFPTKQQIIDAYTEGNLIYQKVRYDDVDTVFGPVDVYYNTEEENWYVLFSFRDVSFDLVLE